MAGGSSVFDGHGILCDGDAQGLSVGAVLYRGGLTMDYIGVGKRIQEFRKQCGYTQETLEEAANLSLTYLSYIERAVKKPASSRWLGL